MAGARRASRRARTLGSRARCSSTASTISTALERDAVETLARVAGADVTVSLTYEPGRAALAARARAVEELRPLADAVLELPALDDHYAPGSGGPASPGARTVRARRGADRRRAPAVSCSRRVVSEPRPSWSPPRCPSCSGPACPRRRSSSCTAPSTGRRRSWNGYSRSTGSPLAGDGRVAAGAHRRSAGPCWRRRAARCSPSRRGRRRPARPTFAPPGSLRHAEVADAARGRRAPGGLRTAAEARERLGWELEELDVLRAAAAPRPGELAAPGASAAGRSRPRQRAAS